ncbi:MAG TPA: AAA family ATPase [Acidimicrobiales bacterium]|nr:AAA family ATPase [Acidimicrobiales bacterium]
MAPNPVTAAERFVGRADELRRIDRICSAAPEGRGAVALVSGEAGIGKTRFCDETAERARRTGLTVVAARCWGEGGAPALWPWQPVLAELCGDEAARLLGAGTAATTVDAVDADRFARFSAIVDALGTVASRAPACIVIDDIHAADAGTLLLTRFVARAIHRLPLALIVSRRSGEPPEDSLEARLLAEIEREAIPVVLRHFDLDEATTFLADQGLRQLAPDLVLALLKVTGGNPLFLRRIAALGAPDPQRALPRGLRVAIDQALAALSPPAQLVLRASAVLGLTPAVSEAAVVSQADPHAVLDAVVEATGAGLVTSVPADAPHRFGFTHELVRSALEDTLAPGERLDAHARAARVVAGADAGTAASAVAPADRLARRAHHALAAAPRSAADARTAVGACRDAARSMMNSFAYERADALLSAAVDLHHPASLGHPPAELLVTWAQAALLCGRLGEARLRFDRATSAAESAGDDPVLFAEAALGLGGHWLNEHRAPLDRARVLGLQRAALARLPAGHEALRCRLAARLAAENVYDGGPIEPVQEALAAARRSGDLRALAEALSLCHHALLAPEFAECRLDLADELVRVAAEGGHGVLGLMGLCWRAVDLFLLGHDRAVRALEDLRARADALECQNILYIVDVLDVMLLIRAGRLDDAEAAAARCYDRGVAVGEVDAIGYLGAHTLAIRWIQGRDAEILEAAEDMAASNTLVEAEFGFRASAAAVAARAGHHERARAGLGLLCSRGLAALPRSSTWLAGMAAIVEVAAIEADVAVAREAYQLLIPFADRPVMPSLGVICLGSTERFLGLAARATGDTDRAITHFERAIGADRGLGNRPLAAIAAADLASTLARRARAGDGARSASLWDRAIRDAESMGMSRRADAWRAESSTPAEPVVPVAATTIDLARGNGRGGGLRHEQWGFMRRHGRGWLVELGEHRAVVPDLVGMVYLAELVEHPAQPISALTLAGGGSPGEPRHELIDRQARDAYALRARELAGDLAEAEADNDLGRADRLRIELDAVVEQIEAATGLGGRPRAFTNERERARTSVRKAIKRAIDEIGGADPVVGEILDAAVVTGSVCMYTPASSRHNVHWTVRPSIDAAAEG